MQKTRKGRASTRCLTKRAFTKRKILEIKKDIKAAKNSIELWLMYYKLKKDTLQLCASVDASFASNDDLLSQQSCTILMCNDSNAYPVIKYSKMKPHGVVRSIMVGEIYSVLKSFDASSIFAFDFSKLFDVIIPIHMFIDGKTLFGVMKKDKQTTNKTFNDQYCSCLAIISPF